MRRLAPLVLLLAVVGCDFSDPTVAEADSTVTVAYEGRLENGTVFDSSPRATFELDQTVEGFQSNVIGMMEGESKTFTVPPELGYGSRTIRDANGNVIIPPNSTLVFDVTLFEVD